MVCTVASSLNNFYATTGIPNLAEGIVNYKTSPSSWASAIVTTQAQTPKCAVGVLKSVSGTKMTIKTKTKFYSAVSGEVRLAVFIIENNIIAPQSTTSGYDNNFEHDNVLRGIVTATFGDALKTNPAAGDEIDKEFTYTISTGVAANMHAVAVLFVGTGTTPTAYLNSHTN